MATLNQCNFLGRVGKDPVIQNFTNGSMNAKFSLATEERYKGKDGNYQKITNWVPIEIVGGAAKTVAQYVKKGSNLLVTNALYKTNKWEDKGQTRYGHVFRSNSFQFADSKPSGGGSNNTSSGTQNSSTGDDFNTGEDLPF